MVTVKPDPRWTDVTIADYEKQLELSLEISEMLTNAHQRIKNIRAIKNQVRDQISLLKKHKNQHPISQKGTQFIDGLTNVENLLIQNKAEVSQDNINYPRVFSNRIGRLYSVVVNADHQPTDGAMERFQDLSEAYQEITQDYDQMMTTELQLFNKALDEAAVPRLILPESLE